MAESVAHVAEMPRQSIGHEFGHQVVVLFLQSPLSSSCAVRKLVQITILPLHAEGEQLMLLCRMSYTSPLLTYIHVHTYIYTSLLPIHTYRDTVDRETS